MDYLADRYLGLSDEKLDELRALGERYCRPVINRAASAEIETAAEPEITEAAATITEVPEDAAETAVAAS